METKTKDEYIKLDVYNTTESIDIINLIKNYNFCDSSDSELGDLINIILDNLANGNFQLSNILNVLKEKISIRDDGTLCIFRQKNPNFIDFSINSKSFDSKYSLKKELRRICQDYNINSEINCKDDINLLKYILKFHPKYDKYKYLEQILIIKHPIKEYNNIRTFAIKNRSNDDNNIIIPFSYVTCVNNMESKWEQAGKKIIKVISTIITIYPREINQYINLIQSLFPPTTRFSVDSFIIYIKIALYSIKLIPCVSSMIIKYILNRLVIIDSEIHVNNPNIWTEERFEKWRQEELQNIVIKIKKGDYNNISDTQKYIKDIGAQKIKFIDLITEEDIDKTAQILDNILLILYEYIFDICTKGIENKMIKDNDKDKEISKEINLKSDNIIKIEKLEISKYTSILSSSDIESSAPEDNLTNASDKYTIYWDNAANLIEILLDAFDTYIITVNKCQFIQLIPIYAISFHEIWCENFMQKLFKRLFKPHEILIIRKIAIDYIISCIYGIKTVNNMKFIIPTIKYLLQFLYEFIAHWNLSKNKDDNKRNDMKLNNSIDIHQSTNLYSLFCYVTERLCWLFYLLYPILIKCIDNDDIENIKIYIDLLFNDRKGFITFIIYGDLNPIDNINIFILNIFLDSCCRIVLYIYKKDPTFSFKEYILALKLWKKLKSLIIDNNQLNKLSFNPNKLNCLEQFYNNMPVRKMLLWHSKRYTKELYSEYIVNELNYMDDVINIDNLDFLVNIYENYIESENIGNIKDNEDNSCFEKVNQINDKNKNIITEFITSPYGKMEPAILPNQSLWEYAWGDEVLQNDILSHHDYSEYSKYSSNNKYNKKHKNFTSGLSLLNILTSSIAYKRSLVQVNNNKHNLDNSKRRKKSLLSKPILD
ncbi:uncharacterized protein CMU_007010 [Cryptosporidium muris RN66]|uniref:Uncharacterized protein n=1 Tax=Cryptosporidium muris (strain RN66) TaxID=441375 RepID=B6ADC1_CRYMR|nr:uncharacterized protein CMU_007010 [Cryptosporidium muris RN66]EEA06212.1 hypothetical protein, conserved [Cryptosporidium muris RN66]|eukprot:XP_002140561.1 hypothetical protein [Cryptosporidium muris RN66]